MKELWEQYPGIYFPPKRCLNWVPLPPKSPEEIKKSNQLSQAYNNKRILRRKAIMWRNKWTYCEDLSISALIDAGREGILDACKNYKPEKGAMLITYASQYIDHYMLECLKEYAYRKRDRSIDLKFDEEDKEDYIIAEIEKALSELNEEASHQPERNHDLFHDGTEASCLKKLDRDEMYHVISRLDKPNARYIYYRYYESPYKQRWESARHFEIPNDFAQELERDSLNEMRRYFYQKMIIAEVGEYGLSTSEIQIVRKEPVQDT